MTSEVHSWRPGKTEPVAGRHLLLVIKIPLVVFSVGWLLLDSSNCFDFSNGGRTGGSREDTSNISGCFIVPDSTSTDLIFRLSAGLTTFRVRYKNDSCACVIEAL